MMTQTSQRVLKAHLVSFARQIGFDSCRIAACTEPAHASEFRQWLRDGAHGEMHYMQRGEEKRCDPQKVLPGARSIVTLALNYFQGEQIRQSPRHVGATGRIARYAWGEDYHDVIEAKLSKIDQFLRSFGGQQKYYVDTGPILERDHAAQAGIGWHGKNTMLIDERLGTWFFLAELLTTLELPSDQPVADRCGTCERCINVCPTNAITAPHQLDARRCISYLTIELKGSIPVELRPLTISSRDRATSRVPRAFQKLSNQACQASGLFAQCMCRLGQRRRRVRHSGARTRGSRSGAINRGARGVGHSSNSVSPRRNPSDWQDLAKC